MTQIFKKIVTVNIIISSAEHIVYNDISSICHQFTFYGLLTPFIWTPTLHQYHLALAIHSFNNSLRLNGIYSMSKNMIIYLAIFSGTSNTVPPRVRSRRPFCQALVMRCQPEDVGCTEDKHHFLRENSAPSIESTSSVDW